MSSQPHQNSIASYAFLLFDSCTAILIPTGIRLWAGEDTVKPPNSDHIGGGTFGLFSEVGPFSESLL